MEYPVALLEWNQAVLALGSFSNPRTGVSAWMEKFREKSYLYHNNNVKTLFKYRLSLASMPHRMLLIPVKSYDTFSEKLLYLVREVGNVL